MPVFNTKDLLSSLEKDVTDLLIQLDKVRSLSNDALNHQPAAGKWSAAQVIEHLNSYNRYYLAEIEKALQRSSSTSFNPMFKAGVFGNYFTKIMQPGKGGTIPNKMNAPKDHVPAARLNSAAVIAEFLEGEAKLISYLKLAAKTDMGKIKVPISISRFINLKLGDTFRFLIAHQQRHFIQLHKALAAN